MSAWGHGTWREQADRIIAAMHSELPADADLQTRRQACLRARPHEYHVTSWGRNVWQQAQRAYLEKHGLPKLRQNLPPDMLSPLDRAKARALRP